MSSSHLAGRQLICSDASWLIPAHRPTGLAVVFVHGYGGDAVRAWSEFDLLLPAQEQTRGADVVFYGYDARWSELIASTALFEEFLDALATDPASILNSCLAPAHARPAVFRYDELIVCAHSLGAVLARGALLHATQDGKSWPARVKTALYAPAHSGARVDRLIGQGYSLFKYFGAGLLAYSFASPLIEQLAPGSADLTDLASQTGAAIEGGQRHLTAALILIAEREHIVLNRPMCRQDPRPIPVAGATHRSVCKPRAEKRAALDSLLKVL